MSVPRPRPMLARKGGTETRDAAPALQEVDPGTLDLPH